MEPSRFVRLKHSEPQSSGPALVWAGCAFRSVVERQGVAPVVLPPVVASLVRFSAALNEVTLPVVALRF